VRRQVAAGEPPQADIKREDAREREGDGQSGRLGEQENGEHHRCPKGVRGGKEWYRNGERSAALHADLRLLVACRREEIEQQQGAQTQRLETARLLLQPGKASAPHCFRQSPLPHDTICVRLILFLTDPG
jgi:hypothetical protein